MAYISVPCLTFAYPKVIMMFCYILNPSATEYCEVWVKVQFNCFHMYHLLPIHFRVALHLCQFFYICVYLYVCYKCLYVVDVIHICFMYMHLYIQIGTYLFLSFKISIGLIFSSCSNTTLSSFKKFIVRLYFFKLKYSWHAMLVSGILCSNLTFEYVMRWLPL